MATYREIADLTRQMCGRTVKTCWIAHVKSDFGLITREAPNRISPTARVHPCPDDVRPAIIAAMRRLGEI